MKKQITTLLAFLLGFASFNWKNSENKDTKNIQNSSIDKQIYEKNDYQIVDEKDDSFVVKNESNKVSQNYLDNKLTEFKIEDENINNISSCFKYDDENNILLFLYSSNDEIIGFIYNDKVYLYIKDYLKDVIGIADQSGKEIVSYSYDAYGNIIDIKDESSNNISKINPIRYRSYYYDEESAFYYLNTRYYSSKFRRFISMDDIEVYSSSPKLDSYINLYLYCNNNPIRNIDPTGQEGVAIGIGVIIVIAATICFVCASLAALIVAQEIAKNSNSSFEVDKEKLKDLMIILNSCVLSAFIRIFKSRKSERHHIVAKASRFAYRARVVFDKYDIDIDDDHNIVELKQRFHRRFHSIMYYSTVNVLVETGNNQKQVFMILDSIKTVLIAVNMVA